MIRREGMPSVASHPRFTSRKNWATNLHCRDAVIDRIPFHGLETGAPDHLDDLLLIFTSPPDSTE